MEAVWMKVMKEHVVEFGDEYANNVFARCGELHRLGAPLAKSWVPTDKLPFDVPPNIVFIDFSRQTDMPASTVPSALDTRCSSTHSSNENPPTELMRMHLQLPLGTPLRPTPVTRILPLN